MKKDEYPDSRILSAWEESRSIPECADKLGVNRKTLWKWLKSLGVDTTRKKYRSTPRSDWGSFAIWLRGYKKPIPKSIKELEKLSGCTRRSIESYLYRRTRLFKQKVVRYVEAYKTKHTHWPDGSEIASGIYTIDVDFWARKATITPEGADSFVIGSTPPEGYKRKTTRSE